MREQLKHYMTENELDQTQVAKAIGVSNSVVSQYLRGIYGGRTEDVDRAVERLIGRHKDKVVERRFNAEFVPTLAAQGCLDVIAAAHIEGGINVLTGAAGLGKTQALKQYVKQNPEVILIEVEPGCSPKVLLKTLCAGLGLNEMGQNHDLFSRIKQKLCLGRLIIVDEAELLSTRSLEYLRRINDLTGCGVVLAGLPRLIINLKGKHGELEQLYSRVDLAWDLGNALTEEDIALLAETGLGSGDFNAALFKASKGNARRLNKLIRGVIRVSEMHGKPIDEALIERYAGMLIH